jgi:hypothetical protein
MEGITMATKVTNAALITEAEKLLAYSKQTMIPYVANGMTLQGMDCQGLAEYLLTKCGVPKAECNLAGSNAHWRKCVWTGTPEECVKTFGCVPGGAFVFIWEEDGAPAKYDGDGLGNAEHMGVYLGDCVIHASSSRGMVAESKFAGKTIPNGGWNRIGLSCWVDYGLSECQEEAISEAISESKIPTNDSTDPPVNTSSVDVSQFFTIKQGCKGGAVRRLQTWLSDLGYSISVDGDFGAKTEAAVKQFQTDHGLEADGIVGKQTWAALAETIKTQG